jgi:hypothetical protein
MKYFKFGFVSFMVAIFGIVMFQISKYNWKIALFIHSIGILFTALALGFYFLDEILGDNKPETENKPMGEKQDGPHL